MPQTTLKWGVDPSAISFKLSASKEPIIRFFGYHDAHPVALTMALFEKFGTDWLGWEPATLRSEILDEFEAPSISPNNWEKIQAVRTLMSSSGFWSEWHIFEKIIQALNNNVPTFDISQRCTLAQLLAGVDIASQIREEPFEDEIGRYISACALDEEILYLPPPLQFAQRFLSQPMYRCKICGNIELDDLDGRCDFCTARFQDEHPLNFRPSPYVPEKVGTELERFLARDPSGVKARFEELLVRKGVTLNDDVLEDVQAAKLMVAHEYQLLRRKQLVDQLEEIKLWVTH